MSAGCIVFLVLGVVTLLVVGLIALFVFYLFYNGNGRRDHGSPGHPVMVKEGAAFSLFTLRFGAGWSVETVRGQIAVRGLRVTNDSDGGDEADIDIELFRDGKQVFDTTCSPDEVVDPHETADVSCFTMAAPKRGYDAIGFVTTDSR